jgi:hypothetical protein
MTPETTETTSNATETGQNPPKGFEDMAKMMEQCGCCGTMENMMRFMQAKCGTANDGEEEAKTASDTEPEDETGGKTGRG